MLMTFTGKNGGWTLIDAAHHPLTEGVGAQGKNHNS